ncbi:MAG: UDP-glucose/GDP-mannose dehydrogenase family protein, partial [Verrucomicrobiaceae bacterium]|nr:UDP-glucose/GDP-mannose dehydrogenase family protein [Verrucomicrobiaceae bacterium]
MSAQQATSVSVFGLGYVGAVTVACLAKAGARVTGVDVQVAKVEAINRGVSPIVEPGLDELVRAGHDAGLIRATTDAAEAVRATETSIVCVGTPSLGSGKVNLEFMRKVAAQIAEAVRAKQQAHTLIFRSTMPPGTTRALVEEFLGDLTTAGLLRVFYCPEFLREGSALADYEEPSLRVLGTEDGNWPAEAPEALPVMDELMCWEEAEMLKYA